MLESLFGKLNKGYNNDKGPCYSHQAKIKIKNQHLFQR